MLVYGSFPSKNHFLPKYAGAHLQLLNKVLYESAKQQLRDVVFSVGTDTPVITKHVRKIEPPTTQLDGRDSETSHLPP
jgi:hypothetical protein